MKCDCDLDYLCPQCEEEQQRELERLRPLYNAERRAGLLRSQEELDQELHDAGRGHLARGTKL